MLHFSKEQMQVERTDETNHLRIYPSLLSLKNFLKVCARFSQTVAHGASCSMKNLSNGAHNHAQPSKDNSTLRT